MKSVSLQVFITHVHDSDGGDDYFSAHTSKEAAYRYLYDSYVRDNWSGRFDDDDIDDYDIDAAVDHYFNDADEYYNIDAELITYTVVELQDAINKAIGLKTSDG